MMMIGDLILIMRFSRRMFDKQWRQANPDSASISETSKTKHSEMHALKLHLKTILMFATWVQSIWETSQTLKPLSLLLPWHQSFWFAAHLEQTYPMIKFTKSVKRIEDLGLDLWEFQNGSYREINDMK